MGKYDPLGAHLKRSGLREVEMSFREIERVIGAMLPNSAQRPQWWANERGAESTHVQARAWLGNGYEAFLIAHRDRVRFRKKGDGVG